MYKVWDMDYNEDLLNYLSSNNISIRGLAQQLGVTHGAISYWIKKKGVPSCINLYKLEKLSNGAVNKDSFNYEREKKEPDASKVHNSRNPDPMDGSSR